MDELGGEVMTPTIQSKPIMETGSLDGPIIDASTSLESVSDTIFETPALEAESEGEDDELGSVDENSLEKAREELEQIQEENKELEPEKDDGFDEALDTLNETIRLLEIQRDALKEQLGGGLVTFITKLADYFFAETLMDKSSLVDESTIQPNEAWKERVRFQLRNIETKIAELKQVRDRLVANK